MTREEFIELLQGENYFSSTEGDKIIITGGFHNHILLDLSTIPSNVEFSNSGFVSMPNLLEIPEGVSFNNTGYVDLSSVRKIAPGTGFNNKGYLSLRSLYNIPADIRFNNRGEIYAAGIHIDSSDYQISPKELGIKGISNRSILNLMIRQGVFL